MYNDEFNNNDMYRFTNRDMPRDDYAPAPRQENVPAVPAQSSGFFHRTWVKITALVRRAQKAAPPSARATAPSPP